VNDGKGGTHSTTRTITASGTQPSALRVQYKPGDANATDNSIRAMFQIVNTGSSAVPLSELKVRYYFTREGSATQTFWCDWASIGSQHVSGSFANITPVTGANNYVEISFSTSAGSVAAGGNSGEIQTRWAKSDWTNYNEPDDYSFDATRTTYSDWTKVTLYRNGTLVWGTAPGSSARSYGTDESTTTSSEGVKIIPYPNPSPDKVTVELTPEWSNADIGLIDQMGRVISSEKAEGLTHTLDISNRAEGLYYIKVASGKRVVVGKIFKR
jgi:hypothetical protein